jgi:hypothetical protein
MLCILMMIMTMIEAQNYEAKSRVYEFRSAKTKQKMSFPSLNEILITAGELSLIGCVESTM